MIQQSELDKMDLPAVERAIKERQELIQQMVGQLYPAILRDEVLQLFERRALIEVVPKKSAQ